MAKRILKVIVKKVPDKDPPRWFVTTTEMDGNVAHISASLPGDFTLAQANLLGLHIVMAYRVAGWTVSFKRATRAGE